MNHQAMAASTTMIVIAVTITRPTLVSIRIQ